MSGQILIVDDDQSMCEMLEADLKRRGYEVTWYTSASEAFKIFKEGMFDVMLTDLNMPDMNGVELCERVTANRPDIPVVVITAFGSMETAIAAMRAGAYDFVTKPIEMDLLVITLQRAVNHRVLKEKIKILSDTIEQSQHFDELMGASPVMQEVYDQIRRIADSEASVLITGESGTGKELVAKALHHQSRRHAKSFVAINCAALPETLLESELFGHAKGAFTDARSERKGLFLQADGGTLFLDEIGAFPLTLQPKLLRVLEERRVRPVGHDKEIAFNTRVIAGTNRDLESAVDEGRFREDLFFRINVIPMTLPPLCSRGTDILLLAKYFVEHFAQRSQKSIKGISETAAEKLLGYNWPGNVRELKNAIEHAVAMTRYENISVEDLPEKIRAYKSTDLVFSGSNPRELSSLEEVEKRYILHVLQSVGGNRSMAARILGLDRKTLYRKLQNYESISNQ